MEVEADNYFDTTITMPSYRESYIYGNVFYCLPGDANPPIYYGGYEGINPDNRNGVLFFYNNTIVNPNEQSQEYYFMVFDLSDPGESVDASNNIIDDAVATTGQPTAFLDLLSTSGNAYLGANWISPGFFVSAASWDPSETETGNVAGLTNVINNPQNDPGFVSIDPDSPNFQLTASSQAIDEEQPLAANCPPVQDEYAAPNSGVPIGTVLDLGALQYGE